MTQETGDRHARECQAGRATRRWPQLSTTLCALLAAALLTLVPAPEARAQSGPDETVDGSAAAGVEAGNSGASRKRLRRHWSGKGDDTSPERRIINLAPTSRGRRSRRRRNNNPVLAFNGAGGRDGVAPVNARAGVNPAIRAAAAAGLGQQDGPADGEQPNQDQNQATPGGEGAGGQDGQDGQNGQNGQNTPEQERIDPRPDLKDKPVTIAPGKIALRDFLVFLADFTGLPVIVDSDQQFLSKEIEIVAQLTRVSGEVVKALLEVNQIRLYTEKLFDPRFPNDADKTTEILKVENMAPSTASGRDPKPIVIVQVSELADMERTGDIDPDQYATMVFTLIHIVPQDAIDALNNLVSASSAGATSGGAARGRRASKSLSMVEVKNTQTLIITAKFGLLNYLQQLLQLIDVPFQEPERIVKLVQIDYADASDIAQTIEEFIQGRNRSRRGRFGAAGQRPVTSRTPATGGNAASRASSRSGSRQDDYPTRLIPDLRTNKIIIETYSELDLQDIEMLLGELDIRYDNRRLRTNIYQVRYLKAVEVAQDLSQLIEASGQGGLSRTARGSRSTRGRTSRGRSGVPRVGGTRGGATGQQGGAAQNQPLPSLIVPHEPTNSLLIQAEPEDYDEILNILRKIDAKRRQVFLEAALVQVQSGSSLNFIIELLAGNPDDVATRGLFATNFGLTGLELETFNRVIPDLSAPPIGGFATIMNNGKFPAIIQFFKNNADSQILATPFIVADDNEENRIEVLETRYVTNTSVQQNQTTLQQQTGEPAGISLVITPTISGSENAVFLTMDLSVSAFQGQGTATTLPPKAENTMTSSVTVPDGQIFVIGGLTRENKSKTVDKIPILGDIPILGKLFRSESNDQSQNNLYVFLRAHILTDEDFRDGVDLTRKAQEQISTFDTTLNPFRFERPDVERRRRTTFAEDETSWRHFTVNPDARGPFVPAGDPGVEPGVQAPTDYNGARSIRRGDARDDAPVAPPPGVNERPRTRPEAVPSDAVPSDEAASRAASRPPQLAPAEPPPEELQPASRTEKLRGWFE